MLSNQILAHFLIFLVSLYIAKLVSCFDMDENTITTLKYKKTLWFIFGCVHMLHCALVQCQSSYLLEYPHTQEASASGLSSDDSEYIVSIGNQVAGQSLDYTVQSLQL